MDATSSEPMDATSVAAGQVPMRCSPTIAALTVALAKAQGQFPAIEKDKTAKIQTKTGAAYSYAYADLASVLAAVRKPLSENALAVMQPITVNGRTVSVTTIVAHASGEWIADALDMPIGDPTDARSLASAVTYARRYGLIALLGIAPADEDDDGAHAGPPPAKPSRRQEPIPDSPARPVPTASVITEPQRKKLFGEASAHGWTPEELKPWLLQAYGIESTKLIPQSQFDDILDRVGLDRAAPHRVPGVEG
jgi:hypothetical protein